MKVQLKGKYEEQQNLDLLASAHSTAYLQNADEKWTSL